MFKLDSQQALLATFRRRDRDLVELSPDVTLPALVRGYLAWTHPSGGRVYLVFAPPGGAPTGIVFETIGGAGPAVVQMCDWCHCSGGGSRVALLTTKLRGDRRVGVYVCADLSCRAKLEDEADRSGRSVLPAMAALVERMTRFAQDGLGIDFSPASRT